MINVNLQQLIQALDAETRQDLQSCAERADSRSSSGSHGTGAATCHGPRDLRRLRSCLRVQLIRRVIRAMSPSSLKQVPAGCCHTIGERSMSARAWRAVALGLLLLPGLVGCSGHYRFSDNDYRPLGEPMAVNRGK